MRALAVEVTALLGAGALFLGVVLAARSSVASRSRVTLPPAKVVAQRRWLPNALALTYAFGAYAAGLFLCARGAWMLCGVPLLAHAMVVSSYLEHECIHGLIARSRRVNLLLGTALSWVNGRVYYPMQDLAMMHLQHHDHVSDFEVFPVASFLRAPRYRTFTRVLLAFERLHIPVLFPVIRLQGLVAMLRFGAPDRRVRLCGVLLVRAAFFVALGVWAPAALAGLLLAAIAFILISRFVDAFQHAFHERSELPRGGRAKDVEREQSHTFSLPLAYRWTWLNVAILNFGYHNAHHTLVHCPWYYLPFLHGQLARQLPDDGALRGIRVQASLPTLLAWYHRHRLARLSEGQGEAWSEEGAFSFERFFGAFTDKLGAVPLRRPSSEQGR